eukprot:Blabericola_migrator_1__7098@NODE_359_length_9439_cov_107_095070_g287_i0_p8_GENE_NODE_359_length_9439_cov_107_095070_g287_i0NODE_359_length_9439_cov_107_095070_g287_i0_p8_ORF_typecomplete_len129_score3_06FeoC/PF09012_10/9_9e03FeoC/PF09012_10/4_8e03FeoC/PF09012_10/0_009_NODE_359_length_9439_cov_107_095070_g287_i062456631
MCGCSSNSKERTGRSRSLTPLMAVGMRNSSADGVEVGDMLSCEKGMLIRHVCRCTCMEGHVLLVCEVCGFSGVDRSQVRGLIVQHVAKGGIYRSDHGQCVKTDCGARVGCASWVAGRRLGSQLYFCSV